MVKFILYAELAQYIFRTLNVAITTELVVNTSWETLYILLATFNEADLKIYCATDMIQFSMVFEVNYMYVRKH